MPPNAQGMAPAWGGYVTVDDVDAVVATVAGPGGRVLLAPTDIPTVGRFATIMDPQGATLSLITYARNELAVDEKAIFRSADPRSSCAKRGGNAGDGPVLESLHQPIDVLCMEGEAWCVDRRRDLSTAAAPARKCAAAAGAAGENADRRNVPTLQAGR